MLTDICFGSKSAWRILIIYGESPGAGFTRQDLKNYTKLGNRALSFALKRLTSFKILTRVKNELPLTIYKLNKDNKYAEDILKILKKERTDLNQLPYNFGMVAREFSREVIDSVTVLDIYLFGSVAKGTYREDSDIDFAIVLKEKEVGEDMIIGAIADKISKKINREIQYFILTPDQIINSRKRTKITEEILKHGIKIV